MERVEGLADILDPSIDDHLAFSDAMEVFTDYETYGLDGPLSEMPSLYMDVLNCVRVARANAERYENQKEAYEAFEKEQQAEEERMADEAAPDF